MAGDDNAVAMGLLFSPRGGSALVAAYLSRALIARGWHVTLACGSLGPEGALGNATTFFAGIDTVLTTRAAAERLGSPAKGLSPWESHDLALPDGSALRVTAAPARHGPVAGDRGPVIGFVLHRPGESKGAIYFSGDTVWYEGVAEVARRSPPELVGECAAGAVILVFMSNMLAPVAFAAFVALTGRYDHAFFAAGAFSLICLPLLYGIDRGIEKPDR